MQAVISLIKDQNLKSIIAFGIGIHHAGLHERDRKLVEELFLHQKIQVTSLGLLLMAHVHQLNFLCFLMVLLFP